MAMKYFDSVADIILLYSHGTKVKELGECAETLAEIEKERIGREGNNPYIALAKKIIEYKKGTIEDCEDWYFYKYLDSLENKKLYRFPLQNGEYIEIGIDLLEPFYDESKEIIDPRWHLLVSYYAYIDAAFNHPENVYSQKILEKTGWTTRKPLRRNFSNNKVLDAWMSEAIG